MCGIAGYTVTLYNSFQRLEPFASRMAESIAHRGPDSAGAWADLELGVALAHQRLSVLDLTVAGHQPMQSCCGRYVIVFNGEIYNHLHLRQELSSAGLAPSWRGRSDTETLLAAIAAWGLQVALNRCTGMWALALVDRTERMLYLARDRFGEKPLYWGLIGSGPQRILAFASELAAFRAYPFFNNSINCQALTQLLRFGHVPAPLSIYSGIAKLFPGHFVQIPLPLDPASSIPVSRPWWHLDTLIQAGLTDPVGTESECLELLEHTLFQALSDQAIADVPFGTFLSGGIDSSLITALLQHQSSRPIRTLTIGFDEAAFNEAPHARAVAQYLGTDHVETFLTSADARRLIPSLATIYSEPFADSSQLPTYLLCREARLAGLTVALSGDGGDELFGGYNRYTWGPRIWKRLAFVPAPLRDTLSRAINHIPASTLDAFLSPLPVSHIGQKIHKLAARLRYVGNSDDLYRSLLCNWHDPSYLLQDPISRDFNAYTATDQSLLAPLLDDPVSRMMAWDTLGYLPDDILVKVDRAAMAVGLETRSPFLDHRVAALAWRLPMVMKIRSGTSKWALRQILYKYVPRELLERPKAGFSIPLGDWLRGPLRSWAEDLLHPDRIGREEFLRPEPVTHLWYQHLTGHYDHTNRLWTVLMWQSWLEKWH